MTTNKKRCLAYLREMRSPIEEHMALGGMPKEVQAMMMIQRQKRIPQNIEMGRPGTAG